MFSPVRFVGATSLLAAVASSASFAGWQESGEVVRTFQARVSKYVALHRDRKAVTVPPLVVTSDPYLLFASRAALAAAIRGARADARQGDIFSPEIAAIFRRTIDETLRSHGIGIQAILEDEEQLPTPFEVRVNADYPVGRPLSTMPPCLLDALPALPPELEYRFVEMDLILWDVDAGLIVDFVPGALRSTTTD